MLKHILLAVWLLTGIVLTAASSDRTSWEMTMGEYRITGETNCPGAVAKVGEKVKISINVNSREPGFLRSMLYINGNAQGEARITELGKPVEFSVVPETPGVVFASCVVLDQNKKAVRNKKRRMIIGGMGVIVAPESIVPGNPDIPSDFDEFWKDVREKLNAVPVKAVRTEVELPPQLSKVVCYDVQVDCSGPAKVSGYLCMPRDAKPKSLPALVTFHGAGVRSAYKPTAYGAKAIAFDVNAHGIPNGQPAKFYSDLNRGKLNKYSTRGLEDHHKNYFVGMYQRVMRALDYVKTLPEWDGKNLIVRGASQGGAQSLAAAALDPDVTLCCAEVPALCDLGGRLIGRRPGWPIPNLAPEKQEERKLIEECAYVDNVFFARRIKCPVYLSTGLIDNVCLAPGVYAVYNSLPEGTEKKITPHPNSGHSGSLSYPGRRMINSIIDRN